MYRNKKLLFYKEVDWSLFNDGISLPNELSHIFGQTKKGSMLEEGEFKTIRICLDGSIYYAKIINIGCKKDRTERNNLKLTYSKNSGLYDKLRDLFKYTYEFYLTEGKWNKNRHSPIRLSVDKRGYISIYSTKYQDIYYLKAITIKDINNFVVIEKDKTNENAKPLEDIFKLVYDINNNQYKKNDWITYIIKFHNAWEKQHKKSLLNRNGKYIWGREVLVDSNKKIADVFNESVDKNIVDFFNMKNKSMIEEIEEKDLIQLMCQGDFEFFDFKRIINNLFIRTDKVEDIGTLKDKIINFEGNDNDFMTEKVNKSINSIKHELNRFEDIAIYYDATIEQLNNKIYLQNKEIKVLNSTIADLEYELNESTQALEELEKIKKNLREIKILLEKDNVF